MEMSRQNKMLKKRVRKQQIKWCSDSTHHLIRSVKQREGLWNYTLPEYKMREMKDTWWAEVADELAPYFVGISANIAVEAKLRWNCVRSNFRSVVTKIEKSSNGQDGSTSRPREVTYEFYEDMLFLEQVLPDRYNDCNSIHSIKRESISQKHKTPNRPHDSESCYVQAPFSADSSRSSPTFNHIDSDYASHSQEQIDPLSDSPSPPATPPPKRTIYNSRQPTTSLVLNNTSPSPKSKANNHSVASSQIDDEWRRLGSFVETTARDFSASKPDVAKRFKIALYKLVVEFEERMLVTSSPPPQYLNVGCEESNMIIPKTEM